MGADQRIVLEPLCPAKEDPGVQEYLRLVQALTEATWVELELQPVGAAPARKYLIGSGSGKAVTVSLQASIDFDASLRLGDATQPVS
jgi:DNA-binding CsgD family transcriptional regulator